MKQFVCLMLLFSLSGCGLLISDKGLVKRKMHEYQVYLNRGDWVKAKTYWLKEGVWEKYNGKIVSKNAADAMHDFIQTVPSRTGIILHIEDFQKIDQTRYQTSGYVQVRASESTSQSNWKWTFLIEWELYRNEWRIAKFKDTSAVTKKRS